MRATPSWAASTRVDGSATPTGMCPSRIAATSISRICACRPTLLLKRELDQLVPHGVTGRYGRPAHYAPRLAALAHPRAGIWHLVHAHRAYAALQRQCRCSRVVRGRRRFRRMRSSRWATPNSRSATSCNAEPISLDELLDAVHAQPRFQGATRRWSSGPRACTTGTIAARRSSTRRRGCSASTPVTAARRSPTPCGRQLRELDFIAPFLRAPSRSSSSSRRASPSSRRATSTASSS